MKLAVDQPRLRAAASAACQKLLRHRNEHLHWTGQLSTSALSTATAVMALHQLTAQGSAEPERDARLIRDGLNWLAAHQNEDGGWGDTVKSFSNISTTMLAHAVFHATGTVDEFAAVVQRAQASIQQAGGIPALVARYGKDKTFSIPILTHCALAGVVPWKQVAALPFELSCVSPRFYAAIQLPVVSYALPALIAIGQVRHHFRKPWNPFLAWLREACIPRSLRILNRIQPENGGFLEAVPLTSFVTMSLAAKGLSDHPVTLSGAAFIRQSVLEDGSWPIDTNLATWVTTLSVNALGRENIASVSAESGIASLQQWLLAQQYQEPHPYTQAAPGGWAWTNLPGGVPDADDTPGAILALLELEGNGELGEHGVPPEQVRKSIALAVHWLLKLQNRDGGWPTFCRGWGHLPFDRSSPDLTAHCVRALSRVESWIENRTAVESAIRHGFRFLGKSQRSNGSWVPLWFGNQYVAEEENPVYGTARVLAAYRETGRTSGLSAQDGLRWLRGVQNRDGGWGGSAGAPSSIEETALATEALLEEPDAATEVGRGLNWLMDCLEAAADLEPSPIGFYFAKLWYFERLYPLIFTTSALRRAVASLDQEESGAPAGKGRVAGQG